MVKKYMSRPANISTFCNPLCVSGVGFEFFVSGITKPCSSLRSGSCGRSDITLISISRGVNRAEVTVQFMAQLRSHGLVYVQ